MICGGVGLGHGLSWFVAIHHNFRGVWVEGAEGLTVLPSLVFTTPPTAKAISLATVTLVSNPTSIKYRMIKKSLCTS
jgi:hypothetical protein